MSYTKIDERLDLIRTNLLERGKSDAVPVRLLIAWFGAERRGFLVTHRIREALRKAGLKTVPDFESVHINANVGFELTSPPAAIDEGDISQQAAAASDQQIDSASQDIELIAGALSDPAFRIGRLESANIKPISVPPDATIAEAVTLMLSRDFSQLPVMTSDREVKGVVSWETIGSRLALGNVLTVVRECMKPHHEVQSSDSLFRVIAHIVDHSYVLVRGEDRTITGIVTTTDLSLQFQQLSEPFLLLSEIENHVRLLIDGRFTAAELATAKDSADTLRKIESVADLTFGEYIRLLENPIHWSKTGLQVDRTIFIRELDKVRRIRNDVMHFDPDGITSADHQILRHFVQFLHELRTIMTKRT